MWVESTGEQALKLWTVVEVHEESALGTLPVADGQSSPLPGLDDLVIELDIRSDGVDAHGHQATRRQQILGRQHVSMACRSVAVLEDLQAHDNSKPRGGWKHGEIAVDKAPSALGKSGRQHANRRLRHVEADEVEAARDERHVVATVPASHVDAWPIEYVCADGRGEDVSNERHGCIADVSARSVLAVPCARDVLAPISHEADSSVAGGHDRRSPPPSVRRGEHASF
jgi:hypothetical protein